MDDAGKPVVTSNSALGEHIGTAHDMLGTSDTTGTSDACGGHGDPDNNAAGAARAADGDNAAALRTLSAQHLPHPEVLGYSPRSGGLRAFQASLLARMAAASTEDPQGRRLGVNIGDIPCLLTLAESGELIPVATMPPLTRVPLTQPWYLGLANIRGSLVGIIDLACMAGLPPQEPGRSSRILVFSPALAPNCGLLLSSVHGVRQIGEMHLISNNYDKTSALPGETGRYQDSEGTEWREIGLASLLRDAAFLHIGR